MEPIPYAKQAIDEEDIRAVEEVLKSERITSGPKVKEFEEKLAEYVGAKYAVVVSSGTAALHLACLAVGLKEGDELITSPITFAASANCALYCNAKPVFVDVNEQGLIDAEKIEGKITSRTRAIIPVHYTGLSCDMEKIKEIANKYNLIVIEDACHALGGKYRDSKIGDCKYCDMAIFSFHPVKHIATGEGGAITTNSKELYEKLSLLKTHGITKDKEKMQEKQEGDWYYEMHELGYNYRLTDIQCALGISQLKKIDSFIARRREIMKRYHEAFKNNPEIEIIIERQEKINPYHLYIVKVKNSEIRRRLYDFLKENNIFCQVHYIPIYWHPYYKNLGYEKGLCSEAEKFYDRIISLPMYPSLKNEEQEYVIKKINEFFGTGNIKKRGIIIQARMASTRLPGKIMNNLAGKPVLKHVVERCKKSKVDEVIVATSVNTENNVIENFCKENNYSFFRGNEEDVLDRYYQAAKKFNLKIIVRITSDCPLISPKIIDKCIEKFDTEKCDYLGNISMRSFPRGLDVEVFSFEALEKAHMLATEKQHREHVTAFIYNNPKMFKIRNLIASGELEGLRRPEIRLALDTEQDLKLLEVIFNNIQKEFIDIEDVILFLDRNPKFIEMNRESEKEHLKRSENIKQEFIE